MRARGIRGSYLVALPMLFQLGCGLILKGPAQRVAVSSEPTNAHIETVTRDGTRDGETPVELLLSRRRPFQAIVRVTKPGYYSACRIIIGRRDPFLVTLDSIPAAIPLLLDMMAGTWPVDYPPSVDIPLKPLPEGYVDLLPAATDLLAAFQNAKINYCDPPDQLKKWMELRSRYANRAPQIVVSAGELSTPYEVVGRVDVNATGVDYFTFNYWRVGAFGSFQGRRFQHKEDPASMNEILKYKAFELYGDSFDAILNVHYESMPANAVSAGGVAVHYVDRAPGTATRVDHGTRLQELRNLLDQKLITPDEYELKRKQILDAL